MGFATSIHNDQNKKATFERRNKSGLIAPSQRITGEVEKEKGGEGRIEGRCQIQNNKSSESGGHNKNNAQISSPSENRKSKARK